VRGQRVFQEKGKTEVFPLNKHILFIIIFCAFEDGTFQKTQIYYRRKNQRMEARILTSAVPSKHAIGIW